MKRFILKNGILIGFACLIFSMTSCNPAVRTVLNAEYPTLDYNKKVYIVNQNDMTPEQSVKIGEVKIKDSGFTTRCTYDYVIEKAKLAARKAGGNAIKITEHKPPTAFGSTCHRINADILLIDDIENCIIQEQKEEVSDVDYAILHIYRYSGIGALIGYDVKIDDQILCRVKNNYKTTVHVTKEGLQTIWAKTEAKSEVPVKLEHGHEYFIRCSVKMGAFVGRPNLTLVDYSIGKSEFEAFNAKHIE